MADLRSLAISRGKGTLIFSPELIQEEEGANYRDMESPETQAHIEKMVAVINAVGTDPFPAITIYRKDGIPYVRAGWCRRRAHAIAKKGILCIPSEMGEIEATLDVLNSNDNLPLKPMEVAKALKHLVDLQCTITEIAKSRGVTPTAISNLLALLDLPAPAAQMVQNNEISATFAIETVRKDGAIFGTEKLRDAVENAKEQGKDHATKKHLPKPTYKEPKITDGYTIDVDLAKDPAADTCEEERTRLHTIFGNPTKIPGPAGECTNCRLLGKALLKIINAKNSEDQQQQIMNARKLVKS